MSNLLANLNTEQLQAVTLPPQHALTPSPAPARARRAC